MANSNPSDGSADDFFEQILGFPANFAGATVPNLAGNEGSLAGTAAAANLMMLQLSSAGDGSGHHHHHNLAGGIGGGGGFHFPLGLSLEHGKGGFLKMDDASGSGKRFRNDVVDSRVSSSGFQGQPMPKTVQTALNPPAVRPTRVRARRGQATDPHSIAERLRRERIAERIRALQDLVPSVNKIELQCSMKLWIM